MSKVNDQYDAYWSQRTPMEKIERTCSLFEELKKMIIHKVNLENGPLTLNEIKIKVARKLYLTDPHIQHLLNKAAKN